MIPLIEINYVAASYRVAAETIEKDYVISWILLCLSKSGLMDDFIFYGGTAIKRMYFEEHRFSEDIDLLSTRKFSLDFLKNRMLKIHWEVRLSKQVGALPSVDKVINDVELKLRELFIQT